MREATSKGKGSQGRKPNDRNAPETVVTCVQEGN